MATKKKMLQAAAGQAGGAGLDITDVFSTYLYTGNGSTQTITNGIDLDGEGGLVWFKARNDSGTTYPHALFDTERGANNWISSDSTAAEVADNNALNDFNADGFDLGPDSRVNASKDYASWTFRKAPKFFDVVTYTGDGTGDKVLNHNLGTTVGCVIIKNTTSGANYSGNWSVHHRSLGTGQSAYLCLNLSDSEGQSAGTTGVNPVFASTDTTVTIRGGGAGEYNESGVGYVVYLFAHNDGDGEFGPDGDQDIIKCGSFPWGSTSGTEVNLGFEPQWILFKAADQAGKDWFIFDAMRGIVTGGLSGDGDAALFPNTSGAENVNTWGVDLTPTGFIAYGNNIASSGNIIYMAIRRGPLAQPESATEVFAVDALQSPSTSPAFQSGFPVDLALVRNVGTTYDWYVKDRLRGTPNLKTNSTGAEASFFSNADFDYMDGWYDSGANTSFYSWMWKRAPGYFDVVAYSGNSTAGRTVSHNLGVAPDLLIVKRRTGGGASWTTYVSALGATKYLRVNNTNAAATSSLFWNNTSPTDSVFTLGTEADVNGSGEDYIAYLFATLPGVSKVGSYTGNGSSQTIDCGFTSGARFVLIKRTDAVGSWFVWDAERGIVSGNEPYLTLNQTSAEDSGSDTVDPDSSGFIVNETNYLNQNTSGASYIFYAIA